MTTWKFKAWQPPEPRESKKDVPLFHDKHQNTMSYSSSQSRADFQGETTSTKSSFGVVDLNIKPRDLLDLDDFELHGNSTEMEELLQSIESSFEWGGAGTASVDEIATDILQPRKTPEERLQLQRRPSTGQLRLLTGRYDSSMNREEIRSPSTETTDSNSHCLSRQLSLDSTVADTHTNFSCSSPQPSLHSNSTSFKAPSSRSSSGPGERSSGAEKSTYPSTSKEGQSVQLIQEADSELRDESVHSSANLDVIASGREQEFSVGNIRLNSPSLDSSDERSLRSPTAPTEKSSSTTVPHSGLHSKLSASSRTANSLQNTQRDKRKRTSSHGIANEQGERPTKQRKSSYLERCVIDKGGQVSCSPNRQSPQDAFDRSLNHAQSGMSDASAQPGYVQKNLELVNCCDNCGLSSELLLAVTRKALAVDRYLITVLLEDHGHEYFLSQSWIHTLRSYLAVIKEHISSSVNDSPVNASASHTAGKRDTQSSTDEDDGDSTTEFHVVRDCAREPKRLEPSSSTSELESLRLRSWEIENQAEPWASRKPSKSMQATGSSTGDQASVAERRTRRPFLPKEDDLICKLRRTEASWNAIYRKFCQVFPDRRTLATLQQRHRKLEVELEANRRKTKGKSLRKRMGRKSYCESGN